MVDYFKLWITDKEQIARVMDNPLCDVIEKHKRKGGEIIEYPSDCKWSEFALTFKSPTWLEITGSLHKYWNNGSNENDFTFGNIRSAIDSFCTNLNIRPEYAELINLEIGVNINPGFNASEVIEQIICYNNKRALRPYEGRKKPFYFIEFKHSEHYFKIYDKGKQYKTGNILRIEYKAMTSREINQSGAIALQDLNSKDVLQSLGMKLMQFYKGLVFTDSTINRSNLSNKDELLLLEMENPKNWVIPKEGKKTTTQWRKEQRFISLVQSKGEKNLYPFIELLIKKKVEELLSESCNHFLSTYTLKSLQKRLCGYCGRDISHQRKGSKYCSEKYNGKDGKHCRNSIANPRNNKKNKIKKIISRGILFDFMQFIARNNKGRYFAIDRNGSVLINRKDDPIVQEQTENDGKQLSIF